MFNIDRTGGVQKLFTLTDPKHAHYNFLFGRPVAEFKEFERFKFKPRLKYCWFHLKLYQMFQDLCRRLI